MVQIQETDSTLKITGHARREVCAMITAITMGFIQNATEETGSEPAHTIRDGYFYINLEPLQASDNKAAEILSRCLRRNLRTIAEEYPGAVQYIRI